jgi:hypothetical protein
LQQRNRPVARRAGWGAATLKIIRAQHPMIRFYGSYQ